LTINNGGQLWGGNGLMLEIKPGATVKQTYNGVEVDWFEPGHSYIYVYRNQKDSARRCCFMPRIPV
jgi:hypothetical protein